MSAAKRKLKIDMSQLEIAFEGFGMQDSFLGEEMDAAHLNLRSGQAVWPWTEEENQNCWADDEHLACPADLLLLARPNNRKAVEKASMAKPRPSDRPRSSSPCLAH